MQLLSCFLIVFLSSCLGKLDQKQMQSTIEQAKACYKELGMAEDSDLVMRAIQNVDLDFSDQEVDFIRCVQLKQGVLDAEGNYHTQKIKDFFLQSKTFNEENVNEVVDACFDLPEEMPVKEKVRKSYSCLLTKKKFDFV
ncbi:uncharacterized protein LOC128092839 [Culex pipiens pallens]|uniref:uncharacterized protein LOC128092839 n=1 Tax=Culex pipiens pallens TaxID=42434 RepID=UPI0022AB3587|nr:uncharacterized protein LOC128092839 [Culex pipiens pallens]